MHICLLLYFQRSNVLSVEIRTHLCLFSCYIWCKVYFTLMISLRLTLIIRMFRWLGDVGKPKDDLSQVYLARWDPSFQAPWIQANLNKIKLNKGPDQCVCMRSGLLLPSGKKDKLQDVHQLSSWNFLWMQIYCIILENYNHLVQIFPCMWPELYVFWFAGRQEGSKVVCVMTPREQLRKMTALGEQGALDEKHWYRLVNGMSAGGGTR